MPLFPFLLIFVSLFLHVGWNLLSKKDNPSLGFFVLMDGFSFLLALPFLLFSHFHFRDLPPLFWLCFAGSLLGECGYIMSLAQGYRRADISLFYPLVRALPVALLALLALIPFMRRVTGRQLSWWAVAGCFVITASCILMSWQPRPAANAPATAAVRHGLDWRLWLWVVIGAVGTCLYSACDYGCTNAIKRQLHLAQLPAVDGFGYLCMIELGIVLTNICNVVMLPGERAALAQHLRRPWIALLAGFFNAACYGLILLAMPRVKNAALVFAFRQLGLPIGFIAGILLFHERSSWPKVVGLVGLLIGLALTTL